MRGWVAVVVCILGLGLACGGTRPAPSPAPQPGGQGPQPPSSLPSCTPTTCAAQHKSCGSLPDGCGGTLACGSCGAGQTCGGGGTPNVCGAPGPNATAPGVPTNVTAVAGDGSAVVSWTAPASNGGSAITGYTVTVNPGGATVSTPGETSATVTGLSNGVPYTFTVTATNAVGTGLASDPSNPATPQAGTCPDQGPASPSCAGLVPGMVSPMSRDLDLGVSESCQGHPAMDGAGDLLFKGGYIGEGVSDWHLLAPDGTPRRDLSLDPVPDVWSQASGFQLVNLVCGGGASGASLEAYDGAGNQLAEVSLGGYAGCAGTQFSSAPDPAGGTVLAWVSSPGNMVGGDSAPVSLLLQRFDAAGRARFAAVTVASWTLASGAQPTVVAGTDTLGRTLVLWNGDDSFTAGATAGRWFNPDGTPLGAAFAADVPQPASARSSRELVPLIGGGLVLQLDGTWTRQFASGDARALTPPCWLTRRAGISLQLVRGGRAYAVLPSAPSAPACSQQVEILAPDGATCGRLTFDTSPSPCSQSQLVLGAGGTIVQQLDPAHPLPANHQGCTQKWWPGVLR